MLGRHCHPKGEKSERKKGSRAPRMPRAQQGRFLCILRLRMHPLWPQAPPPGPSGAAAAPPHGSRQGVPALETSGKRILATQAEAGDPNPEVL